MEWTANVGRYNRKDSIHIGFARPDEMPSIPNRESDITHPVVFTTQTPYTLPAQKFMIPATWKRYHLSQLVNKALSLTSPVPFDFLVQGEILRGTLGEWCAEKGIEEVGSSFLGSFVCSSLITLH